MNRRDHFLIIFLLRSRIAVVQVHQTGPCPTRMHSSVQRKENLIWRHLDKPVLITVAEDMDVEDSEAAEVSVVVAVDTMAGADEAEGIPGEVPQDRTVRTQRQLCKARYLCFDREFTCMLSYAICHGVRYWYEMGIG